MKLNTRKLMIQYCILQGSYWASFCVIYAFATVFLLSRGFESSMIGVIIAAGNILGVILQPMVASIADRSEKISLHKLTAMLSVIMICTQRITCCCCFISFDRYLSSGYSAAD